MPVITDLSKQSSSLNVAERLKVKVATLEAYISHSSPAMLANIDFVNLPSLQGSEAQKYHMLRVVRGRNVADSMDLSRAIIAHSADKMNALYREPQLKRFEQNIALCDRLEAALCPNHLQARENAQQRSFEAKQRIGWQMAA